MKIEYSLWFSHFNRHEVEIDFPYYCSTLLDPEDDYETERYKEYVKIERLVPEFYSPYFKITKIREKSPTSSISSTVNPKTKAYELTLDYVHGLVFKGSSDNYFNSECFSVISESEFKQVLFKLL